VDREVTLRQAGQRADEVGGQAADQTRAHETESTYQSAGCRRTPRGGHLVGVGGLQVTRGGEDRIDRVETGLAAVVVGVDAIALPGRGHELHPAHGAGARDVEVAPVVGLDLVDRGEDLPAHAVLDAGAW